MDTQESTLLHVLSCHYMSYQHNFMSMHFTSFSSHFIMCFTIVFFARPRDQLARSQDIPRHAMVTYLTHRRELDVSRSADHHAPGASRAAGPEALHLGRASFERMPQRAKKRISRYFNMHEKHKEGSQGKTKRLTEGIWMTQETEARSLGPYRSQS